MVKKVRKQTGRGVDPAQFAEAVRGSAQQIWLAGLGAFAKARNDRDKLFEMLVRQGRTLQARTKALAEERIGEVGEAMNEARAKVGRQATESWDRLEQVFEERVSRALGRLGVPSAREVEELAKRVDAIAAKLGASAGKKPVRKGAAKKAAAKKPAARKAVAKKAAPRKPAAKKAAPRAVPAARKPAAKKAAAPRARKVAAPVAPPAAETPAAESAS